MAATIGGPVAAPLQPPPGVNAGDHSEDMLHKLDDFKSLMSKERMGFLYARWREHSCADPARRGQWQSQPMFGEGWQEKEDSDKGGLWQLKIINWGLMWDARGRMNNLHTSGEAMQTGVDQVFQRIHGAWTSKAGDAAAARFTDLRAAAREYTAQLQTLGLHMEGAWRATRHAVEQLADFANKSDVGGKPMMDRYGAEGRSDDTGNEKRGQMSRWIDEIDVALRNGTYRWGIGGEAHEVIPDNTSLLPTRRMPQNAESVRRPGEVYLTEGDNAWANETCNWLDDFCHCYYLTVANFRRRVEQTLQEVENNWQNLEKMSSTIIADPFGKLSLTATQSTGDNGRKNPNDTGTDRPGTSSTGTGTSGTGTGTGTGTSGTGTPLPPVQPPPLPPMEPVDDTTSPSGVDPIVDPPPGAPDTEAKDQGTVTIDDGDRKISVQTPDSDGHTKVTVDDGTGKPKTYDLDFSAGTGQPTQPGHALPDDGRPQTLPGQERGSHALQEPTADPVQQIQAGPDGKAVVHDGNLTITAEHPPGAPDQIKITIDDGTGKPTTYVVDYSDPANPHAQQAAITAQPTQAGHPNAAAYPAAAGAAEPHPAAAGAEPHPVAAGAEPYPVAAVERYPAADPFPAAPHTAQPMTFTDPATTGLPDPGQTGFTEPLSAESRTFTPPTTGFTDPEPSFTDPATAEPQGFAQPVSGVADSGTDAQSGFADPASSQGRGFAQSASGGFADPAGGAESGFADPASAEPRGFAQSVGGFADSASDAQSGFADPASSQGRGFAQPVGGFGESETGLQSGFADPVAAEARGFAQPVSGFADSASDAQSGFADSESGQGFAPINGGSGDPASGPQSGFADPASSEVRGFAQAANGGFADPAQSGFADSASGESRGFADSAGAEARDFAQSASGGFADLAGGAESGFADPASAEARGFAQPASGFADPVTGPQSGFADSAGGGSFAEPVNGGAPDTGTSTQGVFTEPVSGESQGFAQPAGGGFADPAQQGGFAEPVLGDGRRFADAAAGQQADLLGSEGPPSSSTAPQSAGFTEPVDGGFADQAQSSFADQGFADALSGDFEQAADDGFGALRAGFEDTAAGVEPVNGGFADLSGPGPGPGSEETQPDPAAHAKPDPAVGGFQPAAQPEVFDQAAAQAIDTDQAFDQGATAQASGFAAGPSIGDDLFRDWSTGLSDSDLGGYQSPESAPYERSEQLWTEPAPEVSTSIQALGFDVDTGDGMDSVWSTQGDLFADTPDASEEIAPAAGEAGLAAVPDNGQSPPQQSNATSAGGMGGGMPMMGMGGGAGGGGNTEQERGPSAWSTAGDLFDDGPLSEAERISTVLGDDER